MNADATISGCERNSVFETFVEFGDVYICFKSL